MSSLPNGQQINADNVKRIHTLISTLAPKHIANTGALYRMKSNAIQNQSPTNKTIENAEQQINVEIFRPNVQPFV